MSPPPSALTSPTPMTIRTSADFFSGAANLNHPFGKELAKVHEVAVDFGAGALLLDEEEREMLKRGLGKFTADEYLEEIAGLGVFDDDLGPFARPWI